MYESHINTSSIKKLIHGVCNKVEDAHIMRMKMIKDSVRVKQMNYQVINKTDESHINTGSIK